MKARLLVGLLTVALGGLTSCSNILEENGVINNVAESGMGELRINLVADGTLNAMTKADETRVKTVVEKTAFKIYGKVEGSDAYTELCNYTEGSMTVPAKNYTSIRAEYKTEANNKPFALNAPHYVGTSVDGSYNVQAGQTATTANITANLQNSVVNVKLQDLFKNSTTIEKLQLQVSEEVPTDSENILSLLDGTKNLITDEVFVKEEKDIYIYIKGYIKNEPDKTFEIAKKIKDGTAEKTESQKSYNVTYNLKTENGSLSLIFEVNSIISDVPLGVDIDPYK